MTSKGSYHHGDLRRALVKAALHLIQKEGMDQLTLRKVAKAAGVSHAAPYAHFSSKSELVAAVKEEGFTQLRVAISTAIEKCRGNAEKKLRVLGSAYVAFAAENPTMFQVMFYNPLKRDEPKFDYVAPGKRLFDDLESLVKGYLGENDPKRVRLAAFTAWSMIHGAVSLWIDGPLVHVAPELMERKHFERITDQLVDFTLRALRGS